MSDIHFAAFNLETNTKYAGYMENGEMKFQEKGTPIIEQATDVSDQISSIQNWVHICKLAKVPHFLREICMEYNCKIELQIEKGWIFETV